MSSQFSYLKVMGHLAEKPSRASLLWNTCGAVYLEFLIAVVPVVVILVETWQFLELCAAELILQRAASAAARAAAVVLPDDPVHYANGATHVYAGARQAEIEKAAWLVTRISPYFPQPPQVEVSPNSLAPSAESLAATVTIDFHCMTGPLSLLCPGTGTRKLSRQAVCAYHGASYSYQR